MLTSFTSDYSLGWLCAPVNQRYAERHGYAFMSEVLHPNTASDEAHQDDRHPTWNKVQLVHALLQGLVEDHDAPLPIPRDTTHLLWVDADAAVVQQSVRVEDLWRDLPSSIELLIGEDVTSCCLINAGVFSVRVSEWSLKLWRDVWSSKASRKFHNCRYHEQSALLRQLERRGEGLDLAQHPFHSFCGGHSTPKLFPHVCVLPRHMFNTNRCDLRTEAAMAEARAPGSSAIREEDACEFIFHAAGHPFLRVIGVAGTATLWKPPKNVAVQAVLAHFGLDAPEPIGRSVAGVDADADAPDVEQEALPSPRPLSYGSRHPGRIAN